MLAYEGHFGMTLGSLWGDFGAILERLWVYGGDFSSLWDHYGMIVESLWVKEVRFQKTLIFPTDFNDFPFDCNDFMELRCPLGAIWWSLWGTLGSF